MTIVTVALLELNIVAHELRMNAENTMAICIKFLKRVPYDRVYLKIRLLPETIKWISLKRRSQSKITDHTRQN